MITLHLAVRTHTVAALTEAHTTHRQRPRLACMQQTHPLRIVLRRLQERLVMMMVMNEARVYIFQWTFLVLDMREVEALAWIGHGTGVSVDIARCGSGFPE